MSKKVSESGHLKNLTGFADAIDYVKTYEKYNPSNVKLAVAALNDSFNVFKKVLDDLDAAEASMLDSGRRRVAAFAGVDKLGTKIVAALDANGADKEMHKDAVGMNRKLQGRRAANAKEVTNPTINQISASQRSYDRRADNLEKLRDLAGKLPDYKPNEAELTVEGLTEKANALLAMNRKVSEDNSKRDAAINKRDELFYTEGTGLVSVFKAMKNYVRSVYETRSPEYRQLTAIKIKMIRKAKGKSKKAAVKPGETKK